jgi:hypothetical protein
VDTPGLTDRAQFPTEEIIYSHLGDTKSLWVSVFEHVHTNHPDLAQEWRYYNDGGRWLLKVTRKTKTMCWVGVLHGGFRMTFYFTDKAARALADSAISQDLKDQFDEGKGHGKIRGVTVTMKRKRDLEDVKALIALKLALK